MIVNWCLRPSNLKIHPIHSFEKTVFQILEEIAFIFAQIIYQGFDTACQGLHRSSVQTTLLHRSCLPVCLHQFSLVELSSKVVLASLFRYPIPPRHDHTTWRTPRFYVGRRCRMSRRPSFHSVQMYTFLENLLTPVLPYLWEKKWFYKFDCTTNFVWIINVIC